MKIWLIHPRHFVVSLVLTCLFVSLGVADHLRGLQSEAWESGGAAWGHWGTAPEKYSSWTSHSNRLIPIYTFGIGLNAVQGEASVYRDADRLTKLYGRLPRNTHNPDASWFDQTDVFRLQMDAVTAGKKFIVLVVFDGMDWQTTWAASIHKTGRVGYREGRGSGLHFQDYRTVETDFGYFVTSPHNDGTQIDVDAQTVLTPGGRTPGGYDWRRGGSAPWATPAVPEYLLGKSRAVPHAYTDSASSATSMTSGIKTYNDAINVGPRGEQVVPIARRLQQRGFSIGVVTSVPISHATPACAYSNNVTRDDYQDLTRDLLGLPSIVHRRTPLDGVNVLLGAGWGATRANDANQGANFVPGNRYVTDADLHAIDARNGGRYVVAQRTAVVDGGELLAKAAEQAAQNGQRLFGMFGVTGGHLPYQTADGNYDPAVGVRPVERYDQADIDENPSLAEMTRAALTVLQTNEQGFWLMVEAGDVDWANHDNNIDNSVGAVLSGDAAFHEITKWAEANRCWDDTVVIVTADHGHYFVLRKPEGLIPPAR